MKPPVNRSLIISLGLAVLLMAALVFAGCTSTADTTTPATTVATTVAVNTQNTGIATPAAR